MSARTFDINTAKKYGHVQVIHETGESNGLPMQKGLTVVKVKLYDTVVLTLHRATNVVRLNTGGFKTKTTLSAINTALKQISGYETYKVYIRDGQLYLGNEVDRYTWEDGQVFGGGFGLSVAKL